MILKFTFRNLTKRPFLNLIKVIGLSLALSGLFIITMFLKNELTYDSSHSKSARIYRHTFTSEYIFGGKHFARVFNASFIPEMAEYFPEIENYVRLAPIRGGFIKNDEEFINLNQAFECDSTFLEIFDCKLVVGNPETILDAPGSMIITESFAKRVYGDNNPMGKTLTLPSGQYYEKSVDFTIKGIMKDFVQNSHIHPDFITSPAHKSILDQRGWCYLLLSENADPKNIIDKYIDFISSISESERDEIKMEPYLQNIRDIHLHSDKLREIEPNGNLMLIYTISIAALILLFIALINYANLNIGMAIYSDKFIFMNKISGSSNWINFKYSLFEGIIVIAFTLIVSGLITLVTNNIIQKHYGLNLLENNILWISLVALMFSLLSLLSGILPIFQQALRRVSSFVDLRNNKRKGISKSLIIVQYTISIALIVAVFVIQAQTNFALRSSMGVNNENLICFENVHTSVQAKFPIFKEELLKYNSIESVSAMFEPPGGEANDVFPFELEGYVPDESNNMDNLIGVFPCDYSFASIFNLKFLSGQNFTEKNEDNEGSGEYIINKAAVKRLGFTNPEDIIGKNFDLNFAYGNIEIPSGKIIGVVDDFHFSSIKKEIEPLVFFKRKDIWISNFIINFKSENKEKALEDIKSVWNNLFKAYPFEYTYVSSMYKNVYKTELLQAKLLSIFTFIALFICSMGLLGMSLLVTQSRTKEIGIRKVNGAKVSQIVFMLNWSLIKWIIISFVISVPLAYYSMSKWLESFAYKVPLTWWIFLFAGTLAVFISFITVSLISWKAARSNPVNALRYE